MAGDLEELIGRIRDRLTAGAYLNEAAVSHGILAPILRRLGWDDSDPNEVIPEYTSGRGRVDFALCAAPKRPAVFIEVKGVGRSVEGDRQLFEYAFHAGVPICLLTDGREWSFYLPSGQGSYDDRRFYRLQLDDRSPAECVRYLERYLDRDRVRSGLSLEDASRDYRDAAARRIAADTLERAWRELVAEPEELLVEIVGERAEAICGFRPLPEEATRFLRSLGPISVATGLRATSATLTAPDAQERRSEPRASPPTRQLSVTPGKRGVEYKLLGSTRTATSGNEAFVDIIRELVRRDPNQIEKLSKAVRGTNRNHIARTEREIYPNRPDLARAVEIAPGWLVGLNIANREKMKIIREACQVFDVRFGSDLEISLPNAG